MSKKYLFLMLGVPGSGKSYFSQNLAKELGAVHLNSDAMRLAIFKSREETDRIYHSKNRDILNTYTFGALNYAASGALQSGFSVIYDANNNTGHERLETVKMLLGNFKPIVVWVKTPQDVAVQRAVERRETSSNRRLSAEEASKYVEKIAGEIETPGGGEKSIIIEGTIPFEEQYESFKKQLAEIENE